MNILKYLLPSITLLFFSATVVYADDHDNKKYQDKDGKKYLKKMWDKKGKKTWDKKGKLKQGHMFGPPPMMGDRMGHGGPFAMIEAQGKLFLYNKRTGEVWVCNAFKKTCEQIVVENKDIE
jgi:hypothetical protein